MPKAKRYKEPKVLKRILIILILMLIASIGALIFQPDVQMRIASLAKAEVKQYDASEYLKDVFTKDNIKYLPVRVSSTDQIISKEDIKKDFKEEGLTVVSFSPDTEPVRNGTKVKVKNEEYTGEYTILLYGDVNCNGEVDVLDALDIVMHARQSQILTGESLIAANVDDPNANEVDIYDALRIVNFVLGKTGLIDVLPISDIRNDDENPVITLKENGEPIILKVSTAKEPVTFDLRSGVTVTDNVDYNIKSKLQVSSDLDLEVPGTYTAYYNVTDSNNNKAVPAQRNFIVENYIEGIVIDDENLIKKEFANGDPINKSSMAGLVITPKMAYDDGEEVEPIPLSKFTFSPPTARVVGNETQNQVITITYNGDDIDYDIPPATVTIRVTPHKPVFGNNNFATKVAINGVYKVPKVEAWEDEDETQKLTVSYSLKITKKDGTEEVKGPYKYPDDPNTPDDPDDPDGLYGLDATDKISALIKTDKDNLETKYVISYSATNKYGITRTETVEVEVVDVIEKLTINTENTSLDKSEYIDGDDINLRGLQVIAEMASGNEQTITYNSDLKGSIFVVDPEDTKARYGDNGKQAVSVIYMVNVDPIDGQPKTYHVDGTIKIDVKKKLKTLTIVDVDVDKGEAEEPTKLIGNVYETVYRARLTSGDNEETLTLSNIPDSNITIMPDDEKNTTPIDTSNLLKDAWVKEARDAQGNVIQGQLDLYCVVTEVGDYKISITPKTASKEGYISGEEPSSTEINYSANKEGMKPNWVTIGTFKDEEGNITTDDGVMVKTGKKIYADLTYQIKCSNDRLKVTDKLVEVEPVSQSEFSMYVFITRGMKFVSEDEVSYRLLDSLGNQAIKEVPVAKIELTINKDLNTNNEIDAVMISATIGMSDSALDVKISNMSEARVYNSSKYILSIGKDSGIANNATNKTEIGLNIDIYNSSLASTVSKLGKEDGNYYTILSMRLKDQYTADGESIPITKDMLPNEDGEIADGGIQIKHITADNSELIDVVPVYGTAGVYYEHTDETIINGVDKIGIAISSEVKDQEALAKIKGSKLQVTFGTEKDKVNAVSEITVYTEPASSVIVNQIGTGTIDTKCFNEEPIANLTAGEALSVLKAEDIGIKVSKNNAKEIELEEGKAYNKTSNDANFGFIAKGTGTVNLKFWAKDIGSYTVTPFVKSTGNEGTPITVDVTHHTTINKIILKEGSDLIVPRGGESLFDIKFVHAYDNGNEHPVSNVEAKDVTLKLDKASNSNWKAAPVVGNAIQSTIVDTQETPQDDGIEIVTNESNNIINKIMVSAEQDLLINTQLKLTISVGGYEQQFTVFVGQMRTGTTVTVGDSGSSETENLIVYQKIPKDAEEHIVDTDFGPEKAYKINGTWVYKDIFDRFYTLIKVDANGPNLIVEACLNDEYSKIEQVENGRSVLSFIDYGQIDGTVVSGRIYLQGFTIKNGVPEKVSGTEPITYVGIAVDDGIVNEKLGQNPTDDLVYILTVNVYYKENEDDRLHPIKTIYIQSIKPISEDSNTSAEAGSTLDPAPEETKPNDTTSVPEDTTLETPNVFNDNVDTSVGEPDIE